MKTSRNSWFWVMVSVACLIFGLVCDYYSQTFEMTFENRVLPPDKTGNPVTIPLIKIPQSSAWERVASNVFYAVGISMFVSVVVMTRFEEVRREQQEENLRNLRAKIQEDVLEATMGKFIPPEIVAVVKRDILEQPLVTRRIIWNLDFTLSGEKIILVTTAFHEILNTRATEHTEQKKIINRPNEQGGLESLTVKVAGSELVNFNKSEGLENLETDKDGSFVITYPLKIPAGQMAELQSRFIDYYTLPAVDTLFTTLPTQELEINVRFPPELGFNMVSFATTPLECYYSDEARRNYRFNGSLLPCQGVTYSLTENRRSAEPGEPAPAGPPVPATDGLTVETGFDASCESNNAGAA
jgi:hypothetical protein